LLLAQAVVEKKVTLETTIGSLLDSKLKFADPRIAAITLKQLSTHTSGLPRLPDNLDAGLPQTIRTRIMMKNGCSPISRAPNSKARGLTHAATQTWASVCSAICSGKSMR
jgi:CubicO group peptidase (beta-lactamase class C family)